MNDKDEKKDEKTRENLINEIIDSFEKHGEVASRIVLVGEPGIGKTWLANQVSEAVSRRKPSDYNVLWLHLNKRIEDHRSLYETLAAQLSLFAEFEEGDRNEFDDNSLKILQKELDKMFKEKKKLLLILDDEGHMTTEKHVMDDLNLRDFLKDCSFLKILVTRRVNDPEQIHDATTIAVPPLTEEESLKLLDSSEELLTSSSTVEDWRLLLKTLYDNKEIKEPTLKHCILSKIKSKRLPAAIVVLTKSLDGIKSLSSEQRKLFKELILSSESLEPANASKYAVNRSIYNPLLQLSYELLKLEETVESPIVACFWHILDFYHYSGCAYYRDLIVHWMLEGYFDPVKSVEKAYQDGHSILMKFMDRGILKIQKDNMVVPEYSMRNLLDQDGGFFGRSCLGFDRVYGGDKKKGLGRIIVIDDTIQTIQSKTKKITTLILSGNRLRREISGQFFERSEMKDLEVVVLFDPTFEHLIRSLSKLTELRVLVIRDCDLITDINDLSGLKNLHVLEVSGASYLEEIPNNFFEEMTQLQSLNLSGLGIKSSPTSIENLSMLRCFILRHCSELDNLPNFNVATTKLEVIDIQGAQKLESYFDRVNDWRDYKGKNKNFAHLRNLEHLDFSNTQIIRLPIFHLKDSTKDFSQMPALIRLLLQNCTKLKRLPQLKPLTKLQILDVSGSTNLVEMLEVCLEDKEELRILDISKTILPELADTINEVIHLNQLLLRNCSEIKELPSIEKLTHLEVFDVSGCNNLQKIDGSFGEMSFLHKVDLSGTNLDKLPDKISELSNLKELIIRNCSKLTALPNLEKLTHLEVFDVSGCNNLQKIDGSFGEMSFLHKVDLSGTNLDKLPDKISELSNLKELIIRNCSKLTALPNLENLLHLEIFDVSGCSELSKVEGSFENMFYLCEVNLSKTKLNTFPELPNKSIICSSKRIVFANSSFIKRDEWSQIKMCLSQDSEGFIFSNEAEKPHGESEKLVNLGDKYKYLDPEFSSNMDIVDINRSVDLGTESMAKVEYVSISEYESGSISSIFINFQMRSVKGCWVERCQNMKNLFELDEQQEKEKLSSTPLEKLWISNLPLLTSLCISKGEFIFKNLKTLSIDCCPNIKSLFPMVPENLEILRVKFCDQLECLFKVEEGEVEVSNLRKLYLLDLPVLSVLGVKIPEKKICTIKKCPMLKNIKDEPKREISHTDEISEVQPQKNFESETHTPTQPSEATGSV